jgi:hypothetical protein
VGELLGVRAGILLGAAGMMSAAAFVVASPLLRMRTLPPMSVAEG